MPLCYRITWFIYHRFDFIFGFSFDSNMKEDLLRVYGESGPKPYSSLVIIDLVTERSRLSHSAYLFRSWLSSVLMCCLPQNCTDLNTAGNPFSPVVSNY